ncbi:MAG: hypothetical protein AAGB15_01465 [Pseudomonadota bacterium]
MALELWDTAALVYLATAMQALGLLFRQQILLRVLVLLGSVFFVLFYYFHTAEPLWDAIIGSSLIGAANAIGLMALIYSRVPLGMNERERDFYDAIGRIEPGLFRKLLAIGHLCDTAERVEMTQEGRHPEKLFFVLKGRIDIQKGATSFRIGERVFVGEIAHQLGLPASATATLPEGGIFIEWDSKKLKALSERRPRLGQAIDALISRDMAAKVSTGVQPTDLSVLPEAPVRMLRESVSAA